MILLLLFFNSTLLLHLWKLLTFFPCTDCLACKSEEKLFRKLFSRYNQFIRPVENVSDPVTVYFEVAITQLANVVRLNLQGHPGI